MRLLRSSDGCGGRSSAFYFALNNCSIPTRNPLATATRVASVGFVRPCSSSWMCFGSISARSPSSSWVISVSVRRALTRLPKRAAAF